MLFFEHLQPMYNACAPRLTEDVPHLIFDLASGQRRKKQKSPKPTSSANAELHFRGDTKPEKWLVLLVKSSAGIGRDERADLFDHILDRIPLIDVQQLDAIALACR